VKYTWDFSYDGVTVYLYNVTPKFTFNIAGKYSVTLTVKDLAGAVNSITINVNISKLIKPNINEISYPSEVGLDDGIEIIASIIDPTGLGLAMVMLNYIDVTNSSFNSSMNRVSNELWTFNIPAQHQTGEVRFFIWASNSMGTWNRTLTMTIKVLDKQLPRIITVNYPKTINVNTNIKIDCVVHDNIGISEVKLVYLDIRSNPYNVTMIVTSGNNYSYSIPGQSQAGFLSFYIGVMDVNDNWNRGSIYVIEILHEDLGDIYPPRILDTIPRANSTDVAVNVKIKITFNESMEIDNVGSAITIAPHVDYNLKWENDDTTMYITFKANLTYNQTYRITIGRTATDLAGNALKQFTLKFVTISLKSDQDSDNDGMEDSWEISHGLDPADPNDAGLDDDGDSLINLDEFNAGTDPRDSDTDDDGMPDGWEVEYGLLPRVHDANADPDEDGYTNFEEYTGGSDPSDAGSLPQDKEGEDGGNIFLVLGAILIIIILIIVLLFFITKRKAEEEEEEMRMEKAEKEGVECPECGKELEAVDVYCPDCGAKAFEDEEDLYVEKNRCPECKAVLHADDLICPDCEAEFQWVDEDEEEDEEEEAYEIYEDDEWEE
jgi:hypothetical protein